MLAAIPEETVCCFLDSAGKRAGSRADSDEVSINIKHTFIELVVTPKSARRQRSLTDTELLFVGDDECSSELSDASTGTPSDEERSCIAEARQPTEWGSPCWGPSEDRFYAMGSSDSLLLPTVSEVTAGQASWLSLPHDQQNPWASMATDFSWHDAQAHGGAVGKTTVMLRNLPSQYTRSLMIELLEDEGFEGSYDLVYVPMDFNGNRCLGYSFVNFLTPNDACRCWAAFDGFSDWEESGEAACEAAWSDPHQGFEALVERYRNSPVMHESVPEEWKPACFMDGVRVPFPAPTVPVKAPKQKSKTKKNHR